MDTSVSGGTRMWIENNYNLLYDTTKKIVRQDEVLDDFFHFILEDLITKDYKTNHITDKERMYYFVRVVKNQFYSKTSPFYYKFKRPLQKGQEFDPLLHEEIEDEPTEAPTLEWVYKELERLEWWERDLFHLWMEKGSLKAVSEMTTIPLNTIARNINRTKEWLNKRWNESNF